MRKIVYLDTETTGLKPGQIAQLSYLVEEDKKITKAYNQYFKVDSMDEGASNVTGLTVEKCEKYSGGKVFEDDKAEILEDFKDATLVGHNINFDLRFIQEEFLRAGIYFEVHDKYDTMSSLRDIIKLPSMGKRGGYKPPKLGEAADYANISNQNVIEYMQLIYGTTASAHDSRYDTIALWLICYTLRNAGILTI